MNPRKRTRKEFNMVYDTRELKPYKGYGIDKVYQLNFFNKRVGLPFYLVSEDEDYIGEEYRTLEDAKKFIDSLTIK